MNKTKILMLLAAGALLAGCDKDVSVIPQQTWAADQCLRHSLFLQCMKALPAGPQATKYNDWDEVVSACKSVAYYHSLRAIATIKPECRA